MQCATAEEICLYQNGESAFHHFHLAQTGLTNAMSLAESIAAKMVCHTPSEAIGQVEVGTQCSFPLADKSVGCCFRAGSESRSVQTTETVDQSSYPSVVIDTLATRESIDENPDGTTTASNAGERVMDPPPQVKRGGGASRPSISPSTASGDNSQQGRLRQDHLCDREAGLTAVFVRCSAAALGTCCSSLNHLGHRVRATGSDRHLVQVLRSAAALFTCCSWLNHFDTN
ncbi:uncharacterized protein [Dermacentor albipictus]|uniref:uncharacterized protein isoform X9 n=2 Tax=Dermacentor albipictus TaxID=60249 RepID=UPI0031FD797C